MADRDVLADRDEGADGLARGGVGTGDHGVSKGIYILDPDGIQIEITYEVPRDQWPTEGLAAGTKPLSFNVVSSGRDI